MNVLIVSENLIISLNIFLHVYSLVVHTYKFFFRFSSRYFTLKELDDIWLQTPSSYRFLLLLNRRLWSSVNQRSTSVPVIVVVRRFTVIWDVPIDLSQNLTIWLDLTINASSYSLWSQRSTTTIIQYLFPDIAYQYSSFCSSRFFFLDFLLLVVLSDLFLISMRIFIRSKNENYPGEKIMPNYLYYHIF